MGQMLGDFLEPGWRDRLPPRIVEGVELHQRVDRFTDAHPVFLRSRRRLGDRFRLVSGVMVDVFYDHFLACNWERYHPERGLPAFSASVYDALQRRHGSLTARFQRVLPVMARQDWLSSYGRLEAVDRALLGLSRRLKRANPMAEGGQALRSNYAELEDDFHAFFPELERFAASPPDPED